MLGPRDVATTVEGAELDPVDDASAVTESMIAFGWTPMAASVGDASRTAGAAG
jgi:hypothetical protein